MENTVHNYGISLLSKTLSGSVLADESVKSLFKSKSHFKENTPCNVIFEERMLIFQKQKAIASRDIVSLEAISNYTLFYFRNGKKMLISRTLKEILSNLDAGIFVRVHKSYAINLEHLHTFDLKSEMCVLMKDGKKIEVSRRKKKNFLETVKVYFHNLAVA